MLTLSAIATRSGPRCEASSAIADDEEAMRAATIAAHIFVFIFAFCASNFAVASQFLRVVYFTVSLEILISISQYVELCEPKLWTSKARCKNEPKKRTEKRQDGDLAHVRHPLRPRKHHRVL